MASGPEPRKEALRGRGPAAKGRHQGRLGRGRHGRRSGRRLSPHPGGGGHRQRVDAHDPAGGAHLGRRRDIGAKVARRPCPGSSAGAAHVASRYGKPLRCFRNAAGGRQLRRCHQWAARSGSQARQCATPVHRQSRPRAQNAALRHHAGAWTDRRSQGAPPGGGRARNERDGRPSAHARSPRELRSRSRSPSSIWAGSRPTWYLAWRIGSWSTSTRSSSRCANPRASSAMRRPFARPCAI